MPAKKSKSKFTFRRQYLIYAAIILGLAGLMYYFKSQFIVAWVNGRPISRTAYVNELQKIAKNQALDGLMTKHLISAEASKNRVTVSNEEIETALAAIDERAKEQGTSLDDLLIAQGITRQSLIEEVRLQKLLEKLVGEVTVADEEITGYFDTNRELLYKDKKLDEIREEIREQLQQQAMIAKIQELIARLQSEAQIVNWLE